MLAGVAAPHTWLLALRTTSRSTRPAAGGSGGQKVLPPDDPLLSEAEPWCDQATMRFYPDVYPMDGFATPIPNLILAVTLARSWVARGIANPGAAGLEDCRRAAGVVLGEHAPQRLRTRR